MLKTQILSRWLFFLSLLMGTSSQWLKAPTLNITTQRSGQKTNPQKGTGAKDQAKAAAAREAAARAAAEKSIQPSGALDEAGKDSKTDPEKLQLPPSPLTRASSDFPKKEGSSTSSSVDSLPYAGASASLTSADQEAVDSRTEQESGRGTPKGAVKYIPADLSSSGRSFRSIQNSDPGAGIDLPKSVDNDYNKILGEVRPEDTEKGPYQKPPRQLSSTTSSLSKGLSSAWQTAKNTPAQTLATVKQYSAQGLSSLRATANAAKARAERGFYSAVEITKDAKMRAEQSLSNAIETTKTAANAAKARAKEGLSRAVEITKGPINTATSAALATAAGSGLMSHGSLTETKAISELTGAKASIPPTLGGHIASMETTQFYLYFIGLAMALATPLFFKYISGQRAPQETRFRDRWLRWSKFGNTIKTVAASLLPFLATIPAERLYFFSIKAVAELERMQLPITQDQFLANIRWIIVYAYTAYVILGYVPKLRLAKYIWRLWLRFPIIALSTTTAGIGLGTTLGLNAGVMGALAAGTVSGSIAIYKGLATRLSSLTTTAP